MGTLQLDVNKFLSNFSEVVNMMMDAGLLSSHVFSYTVTQDMSTLAIEERHLQALIKFLEEAKDMLNQLTSQLSHQRRKEGFEDMVLGFENRQGLVPDGLNVSSTCNPEGKAHDGAFPASCGTASYTQLKNAPSLDVRFSSASQPQYGNMNETQCEISSGRFSPLNDTQYNTTDGIPQTRHYSVPDNSSCYDMTASAVGHENSLSSHGAAFNLANHMVVNSHFQPSCESAFDNTANQMMRFPSCSRDTSMKQFPSAPETQSHDSQFVAHEKSQDYASKPSCEFAQPNDTRDSQHFTSPRGHFSPTAESNCDTMYATRCETTQDAHFSCDTSYETSSQSCHGIHNSSVTFQSSSEQPLSAHYAHPTLTAATNFGDPSKNQHGSAFSMVNSLNSSQYTPCQASSEKNQFTANESGQSKMHYPPRNDLCEAPFSQMNGNSNFVGICNEPCNTHVTSRGGTENRYSHVSNFRWGALNDDNGESFGPSSPVQSPNQSHDSSEFGDLQIAFPNQVEKDITDPGIKETGNKGPLESSAENNFSVFLGSRDANNINHENKKETTLDDAKHEKGKWKCPACAKRFLVRLNLERHFKAQHLGEKAYPCNLCEKGFSSKIRLDAHLLRQHNFSSESANPCSVCGKLFRTKFALKTHSLTHADESEKPFACNICNKRFAQKVVLETHLLRHGGPAAYKYQCKICSKTFPTQSKLKFHWRNHENAQFSCKQCPKQFPTESHLRVHEATHVAFSERPHQCSECLKAFTTKYKLQTHMETHGQPNQFFCTECSASFKSRTNLVKHSKRFHQKTEVGQVNPPDIPPSDLEPSQDMDSTPKFKCPVCLKEFNHKRNLQQHEISCHPDVPQQFSCEHCSKLFKSKAKLKFHLLAHTEEPKLSCRTCGKRFYRSDLLRTHEASHAGNKPFSCEVCARRFATQFLLRQHQAIHQPPPETTSEVQCPTCGKKFKNKRSLAFHEKSHAESLEFKCGTCGKEFARRVHYDGHMRTHSADRPYSCTVCTRTFRERKHRAEHMKRLHPNEVLGGGGELTLQKLIDSITADDTMDGSTGGGTFETDVNSDALASLTDLSNSGMQHLLEDSSQRNTESRLDDTSQSQCSQINSTIGSQSRSITLDTQVEATNRISQTTHMNQSFSSQTLGVGLDCQTDMAGPSQVPHLSEPFPEQPLLQNPFHHLKNTPAGPHPFSNRSLDPLPELSDQFESIDCSHSHSGLHPHFARSCEAKSASADDSGGLSKLSDVLAISMQGEL